MYYNEKGDNMANNGRKKYIILGIVGIVAIMALLTVNSIKEGRKLNFFEKAIKDSATFVMDISYKPIGFIKGKIKESNEKSKMYKKYKKIKEIAEKSDSYKARIKELENENNKLKESLDLQNTLTDYKKINASVVNRNVGSWYNTLTINKGSKSGIKDGMAVVVNKGLIGKIISVSNFTSTVKLLSTDELSNKISVKIELEDKSIYGLLTSYDQEKKVYLVEGISDGAEIKSGSKVVTTGLSEIFPSGILIGEVKDVTMDKYELAKAVRVKPSVNFDDFNIVTVLDRESK